MGTIGVVLDTNVLISALGFGGSPLDALLRACEEDVQLVASHETLEELERVMAYDRLPFTEAERTRYPAILRLEATLVQPTASIEVVRDSDDDMFLEVAIEGDAEYLVSRDRDLLDLGSYETIDIVTPGEFMASVE